ncbi:hypothetical protein ACFOLD_09945 [Kocuria carniphila]
MREVRERRRKLWGRIAPQAPNRAGPWKTNAVPVSTGGVRA